MNMLEQKFMEQVPSTLLRIAKALEGIDEKLELLIQQRQEPAKDPVVIPDEVIEFKELDEAVSAIRISNWQTKRAIADALYHRYQYVTKDCAANLSRFYGGVIVRQTQEAIENGEIEAILPEMRDTEVGHWNKTTDQYKKTVVKKPVGKYQVSLKSTILWLEKNGRRQVDQYNPIYSCIEKIINS